MLVFQDGVQYSLKEALLLINENNDTIAAIHAIKKAFDGRLLAPGERVTREEQYAIRYTLPPRSSRLNMKHMKGEQQTLFEPENKRSAMDLLRERINNGKT